MGRRTAGGCRRAGHLGRLAGVVEFGGFRPLRLGILRLRVEVAVEVGVAEFALGVVVLGQGEEVVEAGVEGAEAVGGGGEELGPVGAGVEGGEGGFDFREEGEDWFGFGAPGEVEGEGVLPVGHGEPEVVGGDGAELGGEEERGDVVAELLDGEDGWEGVLAGDEVFGLDFGAGGGGEVHFEVGEALEPGAGDAELVGAVDGVVVADGVEFGALEGGSVEGGGEGFRLGGGGEGFDPDFVGAVVLPVGEERDGVAGREDTVEVVLELGEGEVLVDGLGDVEGGDDVEGDAGGEAEGSEGDDGSGEGVGVVVAVEGDEVAVAVEELEGADGGGEVAVVAAGAVGGGGDAAGDGDVGQRGEVGDGEALRVEPGGELAVADAGSDGDGFFAGVEAHFGEVFEGDLVGGGVGDVVEGVFGAEGFEVGAGAEEVAEFGERGWVIEARGLEGVVAAPVGAGAFVGGGVVGGRLLGGDGGVSECGGGGFHEISLP